ncbi:hypothetical protein H7J50_25900 [Mycobacterium intermedium]|nr:hypothetical protein [Mycobacterium intermedium]ODR02032.1 hypothetical protein BHQ20_06340 [Mycobacterium intermedium]
MDTAGAFVTDPHELFPKVSTFSRCRPIESRRSGELWEVFLHSGTIYLGGRVLIAPPRDNRLQWRSVRGTRHSFEARVEPDDEGSRLTMTLNFSASGLGIARISELIGRGLVVRNLEAAAEEIRHHLEFEL